MLIEAEIVDNQTATYSFHEHLVRFYFSHFRWMLEFVQ